MEYLPLSFIAGILTILAPCVLPVLPVVLGSTLQDTKDRSRPVIIIISLSASIFFFTLLLKASTLLINIDPRFWNILSGGIIFIFGIFTLFPDLWGRIELKLNLSGKSGNLLQKASHRQGVLGSILIGASLGPVFASCSPTYAIILAVILPVDFVAGVINLIVYCIGLATILIPVALLGQKFLSKVKWATNPKGAFKKLLGVLFVILGLMIMTGLEKKLETALLDAGLGDITKIETTLLERMESQTTQDPNTSTLFNVKNPVPAPEITGINSWINSNGLILSGLKGKVVLIDFWTYSCINCIRTLPYLKAWHEKYADKGLVIIGIHAPEFQFEQKLENVTTAVEEFGIEYPVGLDNSYLTWRAYNNKYWPAKYFIDRNGLLRHTHFGEGEYGTSEAVIQALLAEGSDASFSAPVEGSLPPISPLQTPETYLGYQRFQKFLNVEEFAPDTQVKYTLKSDLSAGDWSLGGDWVVDEEASTSVKADSQLNLKFSSKDVYLVITPSNQAAISVKLDGKPISETGKAGQDVGADSLARLSSPKLYHLVHSDTFLSDSVLTLQVPSGVKLFAFTFGS